MLVGGGRRRQRKVREAIAEVLEREGQAQGQLAGGGDGVGQIGEAPRHLEPALELALTVAGEPAAGVIEIGLLADAREDVGQRAPARPAVERLVGGEQRQPRRASQDDEASEIPLLGPIEMTLDLDEAVVAAEDPDQAIENPSRAVALAGGDRARQRAVRAAGQAHEAGRVRRELVERDGRRRPSGRAASDA